MTDSFQDPIFGRFKTHFAHKEIIYCEFVSGAQESSWNPVELMQIEQRCLHKSGPTYWCSRLYSTDRIRWNHESIAQSGSSFEYRRSVPSIQRRPASRCKLKNNSNFRFNWHTVVSILWQLFGVVNEYWTEIPIWSSKILLLTLSHIYK